MEGSNLLQNFKSPDGGKYEYDQYMTYIDEKLPMESPILFYMHPNAEIGYLTITSTFVFNTISSLSSGGNKGGGGANINQLIIGYMDNPELATFSKFDLDERAKAVGLTP